MGGGAGDRPARDGDPRVGPVRQAAEGTGGQGSGLSDAKIADGLKEALEVATGKTVSLTGKTDGYFGNQAIKILMPEKLKTLEGDTAAPPRSGRRSRSR